MAKMAILKTRKYKLTGIGSVDVEVVFISMVNARIKIEYTCFKLINDIQMFFFKYGLLEEFCVSFWKMVCWF